MKLSLVALAAAAAILSALSSACARTPTLAPATLAPATLAPATLAPATLAPAAVSLRAATVAPHALARAPASRRHVRGDTPPEDERRAAEVFRAMNGDLLKCMSRSRRHAFIGVDVLVGPDGAVRDVSTTGGALVGAAAMTCVERRVARARFTPATGGGTFRVRVPFAFSSGLEEP